MNQGVGGRANDWGYHIYNTGLPTVVIQELEVVVRRYDIAGRPWSPYDTNIKLENYVISDK